MLVPKEGTNIVTTTKADTFAGKPNKPKYEAIIRPAEQKLTEVGIKPDEATNMIDAVKSGDKPAAEKYIKDPAVWRRLSNDVAAIGALFTLARLNGRTPSAPVPVAIDNMTQEQVIDTCIRCIDGEKSTIDYGRSSAASERVILDETRRTNLSRRWMKSEAWQNAVSQFNKMTKILQSNDIQGDMSEVIAELQTIMESPTPENVQSFQLCIGMPAEDNAN